MKKLALLISVVLSLNVYTQAAEPTAPLYRTSFLFHGLSMNFGLSAGAYLALKEKQGAPELMVGICGSSLIAAIAYVFPKDDEFREFLDSKLFFDLVSANGFRSIFPYLRPKLNLPFDFTRQYVMTAPNDLNDFLRRSDEYPSAVERKFLRLFSTPIGQVGQEIAAEEAALGIPKRALIILSARSVQTAKEIKKGRLTPRFQENFYITDPRIADRLRFQTSNIYSTLTPKQRKANKIDPEISFDDQETLYRAVRASVSEPVLAQPFIDGTGHLHLAGSLSQHPYEYLQELSGQVNGIFNGMFPKFAVKIFKKAFGYDLNERIRTVLKKGIPTYLVNCADAEKDLEALGANMAPNSHSITYRFPFKIGLNLVPKDHAEFVRQLKVQMEYGADKTVESFAHPKSLEHIDLENEMDL